MVDQALLDKALATAKKENNLEVADVILNGFGVEYVTGPGRTELAYVNLGDTYESTVCREGKDYFITSWGTWYEATEQEYEEDNDVIRCGYCGEFTPTQEGADWRELVCEYCDNLVSG